MKLSPATTISVLLVATLTSYNLSAQQKNVSVYIRNINDYSKTPAYVNKPGRVKQEPVCPDSNPLDNIWETQNDLSVYTNSVLIIRFYNETDSQLLTIGELDINNNLAIQITVEDGLNSINIPCAITPVERNMTDLVLRFNEHYLLTKNVQNALNPLKGNHDLTIKVSFNNAQFKIANGPNPTDISETGSYHASRFDFYGGSGFWVPALQFSSNLKSTTEGIPFASLPVGLAWGGKWLYKRSNYLGASIMINWMFYNQPANTLPEPAATSFTVKAGTYGVLFDINNWMNVGVVYGRNFQKDVPNPGYMATIGFGPQLIQFLKGKEKK